MSYHFINETVILQCVQLSDYPIIWHGPPNLSSYAIGKDINPKLSKKDRLYVVHSTDVSHYDLKIRNFSIDDRGLYKCISRGPDRTFQELFFDLKMASKLKKILRFLPVQTHCLLCTIYVLFFSCFLFLRKNNVNL